MEIIRHAKNCCVLNYPLTLRTFYENRILQLYTTVDFLYRPTFVHLIKFIVFLNNCTLLSFLWMSWLLITNKVRNTDCGWGGPSWDAVAVHRNEWCTELAVALSCLQQQQQQQQQHGELATHSHLSDTLTNHLNIVIALIGDAQLCFVAAGPVYCSIANLELMRSVNE